MIPMSVITRFAPSPTGYLHIWSLRTVLFNYLFTKKNDGKFLLRIEDTDRARFVDGSVDNLLEVLASIWLIPDEGPNNPWEKGPYYQSERLDLYQKHIKTLLENDHAYYCFCSSERLEDLRNEQQSLWLPTKYDKKCRYLTDTEIEEKLKAGEKYTIRLKVPENESIEFRDQVRWKISIWSKEVDDQVLIKTDGFPTYHFAVVVDDHHMWVTDIIRGDEWIPSTPKHILLYKAFWWDIPKYSHVPPLVGHDRKKLSKRSGDVAVEKYIEKWYLVEALINYLALLGWNPKITQEFFSMEELIDKFELKNVQKAWALFDIERLDFFNAHYLKTSDSKILFNKLKKYLQDYDWDYFEKISKFPEEYNYNIFLELKGRIKNFWEYKEYTDFLYEDIKTAPESLYMNSKMKIENKETLIDALKISLKALENQEENIDIEKLKQSIIPMIKEAGMKNGQVLWPTRVALSWQEFSPWAFEMIYIHGKKKSSDILTKVLKTF